MKMGAQVSNPGRAVPRKPESAHPETNLEPFNYADSIPPIWSEIISFRSLPPADYFCRNLPTEPSDSRLLWSVDLHFEPRSERRLIICFAAHFPREGMTPAPVNQYLSGGCISLWRIDSSSKISCWVLPRLKSMCYPCRVAVHPNRPTVCFAGDHGVTLVDLLVPTVNGLHRLSSAGKPNMGEVVKSMALSPNGTRVLIMLRLASSFHLRIVCFNALCAVENEVRLSRLIPSLRLGRTYTETCHCAWSWDGRRVGFAVSTGHYGVLLLRPRRMLGRSIDELEFAGRGDSCLTLEWCRCPADPTSAAFGALSSTRAFAFWPADPSDSPVDCADDWDEIFDCDGNTSCRCLLALGDAAGYLSIVGGFVDSSRDDSDGGCSDSDKEDCNSEKEFDETQLAAYRTVLQVKLCQEDEADLIEIVQFSCSGRLLAVGCRSGCIRVYRFDCRLPRRRRRDGDGEGEGDGECATADGIKVSLQLLRLLQHSSSSATGEPIVSLTFADTEEVLASADAAGFVRLWRLPSPSRLQSISLKSLRAVSSLADLCSRATASRCRIGCADRLPLPPSLLPLLCPNLLDRRQQAGRIRRGSCTGGDRDAEADCDSLLDSTKIFSIKLF